MKKVAILQSNYIPWKGYFDLIAAVDEFVLYDEVQFTKNDWRNRNRIKTPRGLQWLSVPVGQRIDRRVCDVTLDSRWQSKHWKTLEANYRRSAHFDEMTDWLAPLYLDESHARLSDLNRRFITEICARLGIHTRITCSRDYRCAGDPTQRLLDLCAATGATEYVSGPAGKTYIDQRRFDDAGVAITWFDYLGYPEYPQLWGAFEHHVTVLDLLFNCGRDAPRYMRFVA